MSGHDRRAYARPHGGVSRIASLGAVRRAAGWAVRRAAGCVVSAAVLLVVLSAGPAQADEVESDQSVVLVEQAIALIANDAGDERVAERVRDALEAPEKEGVDLAVVTEALAVIEAPGENPAAAAQARTLLVDSIGGTLPSAPEEGRQAVGIETGTSVVLDEFSPPWGITDRGDAVLLGLSLVAILAGLYLAWRLRPPHTLRQLTHPGGLADSQKEER